MTILRKRFYPTIYDALMIATSIALKRGYQIKDGENLADKRMALLKDEMFRESITQGTMQVQHIHTRIDKTLEYIYDMHL